MTQNTVVVTGFGIFRDYVVNPSWEVARSLHSTNIIDELRINLVTTCIPVSYQDVDQMVPELWSQHEPVVSCTRLAGIIISTNFQCTYVFSLWFIWECRLWLTH